MPMIIINAAIRESKLINLGKILGRPRRIATFVYLDGQS